MGDFKLSANKWSLANCEDVSRYSTLESNALTNCSYFNLKQFNTIKYHKNYILDLILSNTFNVDVGC